MKVGNGDTARFWVDRWLDGQSVRAIAPHLFVAVDAAIIGVRSVRQALAGNAWVRDVTGVLTVPVISELLLLHNQLASLPPLCGFDDRLVWKWTTDCVYTTASAYKAKAWAPGKCKIHVWLFLHQRLWTADRRARHGLASHVACPLCESAPETAEHLFLGCPFSRVV